MKLQRLFKMTPAELAFRGRQQAYKTIERLTAPGSETSPVCHFDRQQDDLFFNQIIASLQSDDPETAASQLQQRFQRLAPARFFAGASDQGVAQSLSVYGANVKQRIIASADAICRGEFDILGYGRLSFGSPVNWQLDAISGLAAAAAHWSMINPLAPGQVGDSKVVWELNRHQWLLDLGQAWRLTGDERYAEFAASQVRDWMDHNPPGFGINWSSSLEVAMRLISWCWALFLLRGSKALTPVLFLDMLAWIQAHANHVERYLSQYFSPNTHFTGEALGLFYAGTLLPEFHGASRWCSLGSEILVAEMERQVYSDGVYFEQSTCYQYYTVEIYLHYLILARRNKLTVPEGIAEKLEQMVEFLLHVRRPDGSVPQIGDTDGGWLLPLMRRSPGDYRALFATAALVFHNRHFAWATGVVAAETLWLLGSSAQDCWPLLKPAPPPPDPLHCFRQGGYVVMRSGWDRRAHQLIFDAGALGCPVSGGHGHADLLSIQCSAFGESYLIDAGTFCYTADAGWRNFFRSTHAHNTVLVDGRGQAEPSGPFSWRSRPSARLRQCESMPGYSLADASHDAYARLDDPVTHRRRVIFVDARYWLIVDDLNGNAKHRIDLRYQFAPVPVDIEDDGWVRASGSSSALLLKAFANTTLDTTINQGDVDPPLGWFSPNYGQRLPAPALTCTATARLPLRLVTLIFPLCEATESAPDVEPLIEQGTVAGLKFGTGSKETIRIGDDGVFIDY